jgi:hypothetical protein
MKLCSIQFQFQFILINSTLLGYYRYVISKWLFRSGYFHGALYRKPKLTLRTRQISANESTGHPVIRVFTYLHRSGYFHGTVYRKPKLTLRTRQISANDVIVRPPHISRIYLFTYTFRLLGRGL